jgi:hypothetical protein
MQLLHTLDLSHNAIVTLQAIRALAANQSLHTLSLAFNRCGRFAHMNHMSHVSHVTCFTCHTCHMSHTLNRFADGYQPQALQMLPHLQVNNQPPLPPTHYPSLTLPPPPLHPHRCLTATPVLL